MSQVKKYKNGKFTVTFNPDKCIHSEHCWRELNSVFNPNERPWIQPGRADQQRVIDQVNRCPSGALAYKIEGEDKDTPQVQPLNIKISANGPLLIQGPIEIKQADGTTLTEEGMCALCRCGASSNKPYCDGSHQKAGFEG